MAIFAQSLRHLSIMIEFTYSIVQTQLKMANEKRLHSLSKGSIKNFFYTADQPA
jgi:hypothetical protein